MFNKRVSIFIGHFGSGKTETALNFAREISQLGEKTALVDLDIVNPFFRSSDAEKELEKRNIRLIKPIFANSNIDVPALPSEVISVFEDKSLKVIFDVGGDDLGARAVSRYKDSIEKEDYEMYFVINTKRPFTSTSEKIEEMLLEVQAVTRLKVTSLVNNTNLLENTDAEDVLASNQIIKDVATKHNISFGFICAIPGIAEELKTQTSDNILTMEGFIRLPWDKQ